MSELKLSIGNASLYGDEWHEAEVSIRANDEQIMQIERNFERNLLVTRIIAQIRSEFKKKVFQEIDRCRNRRKDLDQIENAETGINFTIWPDSICGIKISERPYKYRKLTELEQVAVGKLIGDKVSSYIKEKCNKGPKGSQASVHIKYGNIHGYKKSFDVYIVWTAPNGYAGRIKGKEWY